LSAPPPYIVFTGKPVSRLLRDNSMPAGRNPKAAARKSESTTGSRSVSLGSPVLVRITGREFADPDTRADSCIKVN